MKLSPPRTSPLPPVPTDGPRLLVSVAEAAQMTGLSERTVVRLYQSGEWPSIKVGTRRLIVLDRLQRWIADRAS